MSLAADYFRRLHEQIEILQSRSLESIQQAAQMCAQSLSSGGAIHIYDTGHLVSRELVNRAGGLAAYQSLTFDLTVNNPNAFRDRKGLQPKDDEDTIADLVKVVLDRSRVRQGDVLIIGTVSGKTAIAVELAIQAIERKVQVIGLTAVDYSSKLKSDHHSGLRLFEVADLVIDNAAPYGDGMMSLEGIDAPFCPASGLGAAAALWAMTAELIEIMTREAKPPTVFHSINRPDGKELYEKSIERFAELGY